MKLSQAQIEGLIHDVSNALQANRINSVNYGGCGAAAAAMISALRKKGVACEARVVYHCTDADLPTLYKAFVTRDEEVLNNHPEYTEGWGVPIWHVMVHILETNITIDTDSIAPESTVFDDNFLDLDTLKALCEIGGVWNHKFPLSNPQYDNPYQALVDVVQTAIEDYIDVIGE